jgi:acetolactate synthase-1/2/3 large subunit
MQTGWESFCKAWDESPVDWKAVFDAFEKNMKVSDYILRRLADAGITHAFSVYGGAISELMDALTREPRICSVTAQHEQGAGFMAEGYAKASGKPGLVIVTSGPGGGNIVTCLQNAYYDSVPLIALAGQVQTRFIRPAGSKLRQLGFQETPIVEIVKPITKFAATLWSPLGTEALMNRVLMMAREGRPGPVLLELPADIQGAQYVV